MNKLLLGLGGLSTVSVVGVTSVVLHKTFSLFPLTDEEVTNQLKFKTLSSLIKAAKVTENYQQTPCVKEYFQQIDDWNKNESESESEEELFSNNKESLKGCLIVEYKKQLFREDKWKGDFRLLWTLSNEQEGVVMVITSNTNEGKLTIDSESYVLKNEDQRWKVISKSSKADTEVNDSQKIEDWFPTKGDSIKEPEMTEYWDFNPEINKICTSATCIENPYKIKSFNYTWKLQKTNDGLQITQWCKNMSELMTNLFSELTNVESELESINGTWSKSS